MGSQSSSSYFPQSLTPQTHTIDTLSPRPLTTFGGIGSTSVEFLIDSGSSLTLINYKLFKRLSPYLTRLCHPPSPSLRLRLANHSSLSLQWVLHVPITLQLTTRWHTVYVVRDLWRPCIIGNDFIRNHNLQIDGGSQRLSFAPTTYRGSRHPQLKPSYKSKSSKYPNTRDRVPLSSHLSSVSQKTSNSTTENLPDNPDKSSIPTIIPHSSSPTTTCIHHTLSSTPDTPDPPQATSASPPDLSESTLSFTEKQLLTELVQKFPHVFTDKPGRTSTLQHHIDILPNTKPRNNPPYRYAPARRKLIEDNLAEMLTQGVITPSKSP